MIRENDKIRKAVRGNYAKAAILKNSFCCSSSSFFRTPNPDDMSFLLGYSEGNVRPVPERAQASVLINKLRNIIDEENGILPDKKI